MKQTQIIDYRIIEPSDPAYATIARRYNRHVERQNRKAERFHRKGLRRLFGFI